MSVTLAVLIAMPTAAGLKICTKNGEIQGAFEGCPACQGIDPALVNKFHQGEKDMELVDCETGKKLDASIIIAHHLLQQCCQGTVCQPGQIPRVEQCFQPGTDTPQTNLQVTARLGGVDANIQASGITRVSHFLPGGPPVEIDNTVLTGMLTTTNETIPVTVRIGKSFGLKPTKGKARAFLLPPAPPLPARSAVSVAFKVNAEFCLDHLPAGVQIAGLGACSLTP